MAEPIVAVRREPIVRLLAYSGHPSAFMNRSLCLTSLSPGYIVPAHLGVVVSVSPPLSLQPHGTPLTYPSSDGIELNHEGWKFAAFVLPRVPQLSRRILYFDEFSLLKYDVNETFEAQLLKSWLNRIELKVAVVVFTKAAVFFPVII
ncbi:hypothetical protein Nepgr_001792 [Nepenthes gracilis]|uniref:Uncharacterized protein n=1 Tax=Nepenthes gracilis TaxID=150966 RepID=A0AAD3P5Q6_NEPGR|nr:hypothetical protein Nepgr_001792 [Nepenthes gracilis]